MAGGIASALADASRKGGRALTGDFGLFEVDEFWLGPVVEELEPRAMLLGNLFRDQLDRYGELETIADRWAAIVAGAGRRHGARAQRRRPAGRRPRPPRAERRSTSASTTTRSRCPSSSTRRTPSTAAAAATPTPTSAVYLAHLGHYRCPNCGQERPDAGRRRHRRRAARHPQRRLHAARRAAVELPLPGLYNVYNALGAAALTPAASASRSTTSSPAWRPSRPRSAAPRRSTSAAARPRILLVKNPAGANEVLRTLALEDARARPVRRAQRPHRRRPRRLAGSGTPTGSCSSAACAASRARGTRAAELALRMKYAGLRPGPHPRRRRPRARASTRALADGDGPLYVVPTYTALLELRELLDPPRPGEGVLAMNAET